jgi:hypothetical protein
MELVTKEYIFSYVKKDLGWNYYYSIYLPNVINLYNEVISDNFYNEVYLVYNNIPIVYITDLQILLTPKPFELDKSVINLIISENITVDSWNLDLKEEKNKGFSYSINRFLLSPYTGVLTRTLNIKPGIYNLSNTLDTNFNEVLEIYKRTGEFVWARVYVVGNDCLKEIKYPKSSKIDYLYSLFYLVIYLKNKYCYGTISKRNN